MTRFIVEYVHQPQDGAIEGYVLSLCTNYAAYDTFLYIWNGTYPEIEGPSCELN